VSLTIDVDNLLFVNSWSIWRFTSFQRSAVVTAYSTGRLAEILPCSCSSVAWLLSITWREHLRTCCSAGTWYHILQLVYVMALTIMLTPVIFICETFHCATAKITLAYPFGRLLFLKITSPIIAHHLRPWILIFKTQTLRLLWQHTLLWIGILSNCQILQSASNSRWSWWSLRRLVCLIGREHVVWTVPREPRTTWNLVIGLLFNSLRSNLITLWQQLSRRYSHKVTTHLWWESRSIFLKIDHLKSQNILFVRQLVSFRLIDELLVDLWWRLLLGALSLFFCFLCFHLFLFLLLLPLFFLF
jgi:hypothetical protein